MERFVIKRNGEYKLLEDYKIEEAIKKGFYSQGKESGDSVIENVLQKIKKIWRRNVSAHHIVRLI